ncbi:MAG: STAS domain-containing protein [Methylococcaceae bacterium]|jgi:anti-anti-sigma factor
MLNITSNNQLDSLVMGLEGRIDATSAKELEQQCLTLIEAGTTKIVMDFGGVNFISSAGLRVVLLVAKKLEPLSGSLKLSRLNPTLHDVFEISGFSRLFVITTTVEEAL